MDLSQFPFQAVAQWLSEGVVIPFIGAGASHVGIDGPKTPPDGPGLAQQLTQTMAGAFPGDSSTELATVAQFFEHSVFDRAALYDFLHSRFAAAGFASPGVVATTLAAIPRTVPLFLITTNYDPLIEQAFGAVGKPLCVVTQNMRDPGDGASAVNLILPDGGSLRDQSTEFQWSDSRFPSACAFLFKMHGSVRHRIPEEPDDVIITEDDYVDFMVNSGGSVSPYFPPASLTAAYKQRRFLFLGYSLRDWNFRAFLRILALRNALSGREVRRHWAVQLDPDPVDVELWRHRNVNVYQGDLIEFCDRLRAEISASGS